MDMVQSFKLKESQLLLTLTDEKVHQVVAQVSYRDAQYFSRIIKKYFGLSPEQYRIQQKGENL
jgi:two-component system response regulator YesN